MPGARSVARTDRSPPHDTVQECRERRGQGGRTTAFPSCGTTSAAWSLPSPLVLVVELAPQDGADVGSRDTTGQLRVSAPQLIPGISDLEAGEYRRDTILLTVGQA